MLMASGLQGQFSGAQDHVQTIIVYQLSTVTQKGISHGLDPGPLPTCPPWVPGEESTASHPAPRSLAPQPKCVGPSWLPQVNSFSTISHSPDTWTQERGATCIPNGWWQQNSPQQTQQGCQTGILGTSNRGQCHPLKQKENFLEDYQCSQRTRTRSSEGPGQEPDWSHTAELGGYCCCGHGQARMYQGLPAKESHLLQGIP